MLDEADVDAVLGRPPRRRPFEGFLLAIAGVTVVLALVTGIGAAVYNQHRHAVYRSTAVLLIDQEPALTEARNDGVISKLVRLRVKYADLVSTTAFSDPLADTLQLPPGVVHSALSADAPGLGVLLTVSATTGDAARAKRIAAGAADALHDDLVRQQTALGVAPKDQVTLTVVTPARQGDRISPRRSKSLLLGLGVAATVLVLSVVLTGAFYRRR